jgi:CxxC motif-containing protein (DUF1111 family)
MSLSSRLSVATAGTVLLVVGVALSYQVTSQLNQADPSKTPAAKAPAAFDNQSNGFDPTFDDDRIEFEEVETFEDGLGPVYNNTACVSCHQTPVTGGSSQIAELRAGHFGPNPDPKASQRIAFIEHPGGSLVHQRAVVMPPPQDTTITIQEHVRPEDTNRTLRMSTNILGGGFVEAISDIALIDTLDKQISPQFGDLRGTVVLAPVSTAVDESQERVGRFGWKSQHASLLDFSADAYINEMGITSPLQPNENTSDGTPVPQFDGNKDDPEDEAENDHPFGEDVEAFTRFMRSTKAPPRNSKATGQDVSAGEKLFRDNNKTGCAICHVPEWTTLPPTSVLPGAFPKDGIGKYLGNQIIEPFSDFLLHDVGTGDGIVQTQHAQFPSRSRARIRPLAGVTDFSSRQQRHAGHIRELLRGDKTTDVAPNRRALGGDLIDTARMIRTAPLWGLRVRPQLLHDGSAVTIEEAILKHSGQAEKVKINFRDVLTPAERRQLLAFLNSL